MILPDYLINKILLYNIHPVAEILKPIIEICEERKNSILYDFDTTFFYELFFDSDFSAHYCWLCHENTHLGLNASEKFFCESCWSKIDSNDDILYYNSFQLLELKLN